MILPLLLAVLPVLASPPDGFVEVQVITVLPAASGGTVLLADTAHTRVVPIGVGSYEAMVIELRSARRTYERPLTHDLLDTMVDRLGGDVTEVRIDALKANAFVATVTLQRRRRTWNLDARSSDAIALALGHGIPIWCSEEVMLQTGIPWERIQQDLRNNPIDGAL